MIIAADLDRTLIYSRAALAEHGEQPGSLHEVEAGLSWMTPEAAARYADLHRRAIVVPTTTRTPEQWRRVTLPGPSPRYVIAANGGVLLVDGRPDRDWDTVVAGELAEVAPLAEVWAHLGRVCRPEWTVKLRNAAGLFCYAVLHRTQLPAGFVADAAAWAQSRGWQVSLQGRKLYWVPRSLRKSAAVAEIVRRTGSTHVLGAGDSLLDADLLEAADAGIVARHGELVTSGWTAPQVRVTAASGAAAGEEIVRWFARKHFSV